MTIITITADDHEAFLFLCESRKQAAKTQLEGVGLGNAKVTLDFQNKHAILLVEGKPHIKYNWQQSVKQAGLKTIRNKHEKI